MSESGLSDNYEFVLVVGAVCKNRDKQLTHIVRVRFRALLFCHFIQFVNLSTNPKSWWDWLEGSFAAFEMRDEMRELQMCLTAMGSILKTRTYFILIFLKTKTFKLRFM
jgi:hypothetical protein